MTPSRSTDVDPPHPEPAGRSASRPAASGPGWPGRVAPDSAAPAPPVRLPELSRPSAGWRLALRGLDRLPQGLLSRGFGALADTPLPAPLRRPVLGAFVRLTGIDMSEAQGSLSDYASVGQLFVRPLRPGLRPFPADATTLASPVDGVVGASGRITSLTLVQAKGLEYRVEELLGGPTTDARVFEGGTFVTLYLSPRHYHRIHTPLPGRVTRARHIPGSLLPVNEAAVATVDRLFARNERLVAWLDTAAGPVAVAAVGAYNVGRISARFDPAWSGGDGGAVTNRAHPPPPDRDYPTGVPVSAGDELMAFHLGSTVVLLTPPGLELVAGVRPGDEVRAGQVLARPAGSRDRHGS